jgi:site-specific DNA recombinase
MSRSKSTTNQPLRAGIYARYSSDNQSEASIDDQVRTCRARADLEGWEVVEVYADYALSGSTTNRPRLQALVSDARQGRVDIVLAEALDRISRDQEHTAGIWKTLQFAGTKLMTLSEGEVSELHVGLRGTMNAMFLKDLAAKTHRGLAGRVGLGKSGGGISYGYRVARAIDERGEPIRGDRIIDRGEALVVRRIFQMFAGGASPIAIAKALNADKIPGPEGRHWRDTTIRGHALRGTGILRNEIYAGRLIWNRMRFVRDPATGKRVSRLNPEAAWIRTDVPDLRVVDDNLWQRVVVRLVGVREASGANDPDRPRFWETRRSSYILTHKVFCGTCGGAMTNVGRDYLACTTARKQGACTNGRGIRRQTLESLILDALRHRLMAPELVATFVDAFISEWNRSVAETSSGRDDAARELARVERKLTGLIDAIAEGFRAKGLQGQLDELETRRASLTARLEAQPPTPPRLHPNLTQVYRDKIARLHDALQSGPDAQEALEAVRRLIDRIVLTPAAEGKGFEIELIGEIATMVRLGLTNERAVSRPDSAADQVLFERSVKVVAGTGFEPVTFRL